jgi:YgiT-type zinc finger domain-containing protein
MMCVFCMVGETRPQGVIVGKYNQGGDLVALIQHFPAEVCAYCGEEYYHADDWAKVERLLTEGEPPTKMTLFPCMRSVHETSGTHIGPEKGCRGCHHFVTITSKKLHTPPHFCQSSKSAAISVTPGMTATSVNGERGAFSAWIGLKILRRVTVVSVRVRPSALGLTKTYRDSVVRLSVAAMWVPMRV